MTPRDVLLQQIQQNLDEQYQRGYEAGWDAVWASLESFLATEDAERKRRQGVEKSSNDEPAETESMPSWFETVPDVVETPAADSERPASAERRLTPAEQRAVAYVTEHKGLQAKQIRGIGRGILYGLAKAGVLANINGRFYPADHA